MKSKRGAKRVTPELTRDEQQKLDRARAETEAGREKILGDARITNAYVSGVRG